MEPQYDIEQWAAATKIGRHIFNHNYRMTGHELRGWELVKSVVMQDEHDINEKVYMWQKKSSEGQQLVRISVAELNHWRNAQIRLSAELHHNMQPDIPKGTGKLAKIGDVNFVGKKQGSNVVAMIDFTRGNLSISVSSVGEKTVDVSKMASTLDNLFSQPPDKTEIEKGRIAVLSPRSLQVKEAETTTLIENMSKPVARGGWLKIIAPDGELSKEDDTLAYVSSKPGRKKIGKYILNQ